MKHFSQFEANNINLYPSNKTKKRTYPKNLDSFENRYQFLTMVGSVNKKKKEVIYLKIQDVLNCVYPNFEEHSKIKSSKFKIGYKFPEYFHSKENNKKLDSSALNLDKVKSLYHENKVAMIKSFRKVHNSKTVFDDLSNLTTSIENKHENKLDDILFRTNTAHTTQRSLRKGDMNLKYYPSFLSQRKF